MYILYYYPVTHARFCRDLFILYFIFLPTKNRDVELVDGCYYLLVNYYVYEQK